jgi:hypothetical protein
MAINYEFECNENLLKVKASGFDESPDEVISYNAKIQEKALLNNCDKVICDERNLDYKLSIIDTYKLGEYVSANIKGIKRIAILTNVKDKEIGEFWENVVVNRGCTAKVFYDEKEAITWIINT